MSFHLTEKEVDEVSRTLLDYLFQIELREHTPSAQSSPSRSMTTGQTLPERPAQRPLLLSPTAPKREKEPLPPSPSEKESIVTPTEVPSQTASPQRATEPTPGPPEVQTPPPVITPTPPIEPIHPISPPETAIPPSGEPTEPVTLTPSLVSPLPYEKEVTPPEPIQPSPPPLPQPKIEPFPVYLALSESNKQEVNLAVTHLVQTLGLNLSSENMHSKLEQEHSFFIKEHPRWKDWLAQVHKWNQNHILFDCPVVDSSPWVDLMGIQTSLHFSIYCCTSRKEGESIYEILQTISKTQIEKVVFIVSEEKEIQSLTLQFPHLPTFIVFSTSALEKNDKMNELMNEFLVSPVRHILIVQFSPPDADWGLIFLTHFVLCSTRILCGKPENYSPSYPLYQQVLLLICKALFSWKLLNPDRLAKDDQFSYFVNLLHQVAIPQEERAALATNLTEQERTEIEKRLQTIQQELAEISQLKKKMFS
jgi:hypothetical protein